MELLQLRYFYESAKIENFAKVAAKYQVPTPSVSASVRRLEREIGCPLFDRFYNKIHLNENGKLLLNSLNLVFNELDFIIDTLSYPVEGEHNDIRIAIFALRRDIAKKIIEYQQSHPLTSFKTLISSDASFDISSTDIIIDEKGKAYAGYESFELCSARMVLKASKNNPLCGKNITLYQLRNQRFISMSERGNMHSLLLNACKTAGFIPNIVLYCNDSACYTSFIDAGIGIGLSRKRTSSSSHTAATYLDVSDLNIYQTVCCYYNKQKFNSAMLDFMRFLKTCNIQEKFI